MDSNEIIVRKPKINDDFKKISKLLYGTDPYIYPYWFGSLKNCLNEFPPLIAERRFFFYFRHLYVAVLKDTDEIVGVTCILNKNYNLDYDYSELKARNERYCFTIVNYIEGLIEEVKESDFAYISNVCVDPDHRGKGIGNKMLRHIIDEYKERFKQIVLDVLSDNPGAINLYKNLGFKQFTNIFLGFNNPDKEKPEVFSMKMEIEN